MSADTPENKLAAKSWPLVYKHHTHAHFFPKACKEEALNMSNIDAARTGVLHILLDISPLCQLLCVPFLRRLIRELVDPFQAVGVHACIAAKLRLFRHRLELTLQGCPGDVAELRVQLESLGSLLFSRRQLVVSTDVSIRHGVDSDPLARRRPFLM